MARGKFIFGTVGTPRSTPKRPGGTIGSISHLAGQDLHAYEIAWVRSVRVSEKTCLQIKETAEEFQVDLSVHAPYFINLNADDEEWPKSRKRLMDAARAGYMAGATDIIFHPGSYFEQPPEVVLEVAIPRLQGCVEELKQDGVDVTLRPETMGKGALLGSLADTLVMARQVDNVEPCIDFAHLHARAGDGSINSKAEWLELLTAYSEALGEAALGRLHCHLSGIEYSEKGERNHLMIEDSDLDLDALLEALVDMNCGGRILCESPEDMDVDAQLIKDRWESLAAN